jgi:primary-amine oxidase
MTSLVEHPLSSITSNEVERAIELLRATGKLDENSRFAYVGLNEPDKSAIRSFSPGDPFDRELRIVVITEHQSNLVETVVSLSSDQVRSWVELEEVRPSLLFEESVLAMETVRANPEWRAALQRRGIEKFDSIQIDPWPAGSFGLSIETGRRICRCISYIRESPEDNGYAKPIEGVIAFVDMARGQVLEVADHGVVPIPPEKGSYLPEDNAPLRTDLRPYAVVQSEGPSFTVDDNLINWQGWSMRASMDPTEGLVLHSISLDPRRKASQHLSSGIRHRDGRPIRRTRSDARMEERLRRRRVGTRPDGQLARPRMRLSGRVHYLDAVCCTEKGRPYVLRNAICIHEEDYGILWKHADMLSGRTEVRRSRRLVVSSISTVGNYEYGFYWYFYLDGTMQLEVKLTGFCRRWPWARTLDPCNTRRWSRHNLPLPSTSTSST